MPASYVSRLRLEGGVLAAAGLAASAALVARVPASRRWPLNTAAQLTAVTVALGLRGPGQLDRWMTAAVPVDGAELTGEPTPLLHVPVPMILGALTFKGLESVGGPLRPVTARAGWDAALRVTAGAALVGAAQALVLAPQVAAAELRAGRVYVRLPGSRLGRGTLLGFTER